MKDIFLGLDRNPLRKPGGILTHALWKGCNLLLLHAGLSPRLHTLNRLDEIDKRADALDL